MVTLLYVLAETPGINLGPHFKIIIVMVFKSLCVNTYLMWLISQSDNVVKTASNSGRFAPKEDEVSNTPIL